MIRILTILLFSFTCFGLLTAQDCGDGSTPESITLDMTGLDSAGDSGAAANSSGTICFPAGVAADVVAIEWDGVDLGPVGASWCSEAVLDLAGSLFLTFAVGEDNAGPCANGYSSGGIVDLATLGLVFGTDASGCVAWETIESFDDDDGDTVDQTYGAGTVTIYSCPPGVVLPIQLLSFSADKQRNGNQITWKTSSEVNASEIMLEKSNDGENWSILESVTPRGTEVSGASYEVFDDAPFNTTYYRIHTMDFNGYEEYSHIISVEREISRFEVDYVSPNPFAESINVTLNSDVATTANIRLINSVGQLVLQQSNQIEEGVSNISILTDALPAGMYNLSIESGDTKENLTLLKK